MPATHAQSSSAYQLYLFGGFRLRHKGRSVSFTRRKTENLFAYLVLNPQEHAREKIAALFWGAAAVQ